MSFLTLAARAGAVHSRRGARARRVSVVDMAEGDSKN